ncbi:MAG: hypothetical protein L3J28_07735 [Candidatus Polarisedimenticolaceae bacterium]|nr:hypothetical protein [Candidatus Polarisedimenticolaceae bacterium]
MLNRLSPEKRELFSRIDEILFYKWDPISISDTDWSRDEYHPYVPKLFKLALANDQPAPLAAYLNSVTERRLQLKANKPHDLAIAELILAVKERCLDLSINDY